MEFDLDVEGHRHLSRVLRARPGHIFEATDGNGRVGVFEVVESDARRTRVLAKELREVPRLPNSRLVLAVAPPKGDRFDMAVEKACEIGVGAFLPLESQRSVVRVDADSSRLARWRRIARSAMVQSGQCYEAEVRAPRTWKSCFETPDTRSGVERVQNLVCHVGADVRPLVEVMRKVLDPSETWGEESGVESNIALREGPSALRDESAGRPMVPNEGQRLPEIRLFIGPEGGFTEAELAIAQSKGAQFVSLGRTKLRTETAAVVAAALASDVLQCK